MMTSLRDKSSPPVIPSTWESLALMVILLVGAFLRFQHFRDIAFDREQTYPIWQALKTLDEGVFPLAGHGIATLFPHPPLMGYIFLPFLVIGRDFIVVYMMTLTLNSVAIWLVYRGLAGLIGIREALIGTALFAVNPWMIEASRQISLQSLFPFFVCLIFWALIPVLIQQTQHPARQLLIALVGLAIFANTHLVAYGLVLSVGILILVFWKQIPRRPFFVGFGIFIGLLGLYLIGIAGQWQDAHQAIDNYLGEDFRLSGDALGHAVRLVTGWEYTAERGMDAPQHDAALRDDISTIVHWMLTAMLAIGILKAIYVLISQQKFPQEIRDIGLILLVWFWLPILMLSYAWQSVQPFYLILSIPAGYGLVAWGIEPLLQWRVGIWGIIVGLVVTGGINGINSVRFAQEMAAHPGDNLPNILPLAEARQIGQQLQEGYESGRIVYTPMDNEIAVVLAGEILPVVHSDEFDHMMVIPPQGGLYMTFHRRDEGLNSPMHSRIVDLPVRFDDGARMVVWEARQDFKPYYQADIPSDSGVRFIGWWLLDPLQAGKTVELRTYWQVDEVHNPDEVFVAYAEVFDGDGNQLIRTDGAEFPSDTWRVGNWVVQRLSFSIPLDSIGPFGVTVRLFDTNRMTDSIFNYTEDGEEFSTPDISIIPTE